MQNQRVGYDIFFDVFYYLGTFSEPFSRANYQELNIRERHFAENMWSLLQSYSVQDHQQFFSIDDSQFLQILLSLYQPKTTKEDSLQSLMEACMHIRKQSSSQKVINMDMFSPDLDDPQPFQNLIT